MTEFLLLLALIGHPPDGWIPHQGPGGPTDEVRSCANWMVPGWTVASTEAAVAIRSAPDGPRQDVLPFPVPFEGVLLPRHPPPPSSGQPAGERPRWNEAAAVEHLARHHVAEIEDGWLIAFGAGEFGGSLWWYPPTSSRRELLFEGNVADVVPVRSGSEALVFTGLRHMGVDYGSVRVLRFKNARPHLQELLDLEEAPTVVTPFDDTAALALTASKLVKVSASGTTEDLCSLDSGSLYPTSLTRHGPDEVWIGMRHFVVRLRPWVDRGCEIEWFVPADCATLVRRDRGCTCGDTEKR